MDNSAKFTRFRAYQLGIPGSLFSYFDGANFTLIEANITRSSIPSLQDELKICGKNKIDNLHITSWDADHCSPSILEQILKYLKPKVVEYPGYVPDSACGRESLKVIEAYERLNLSSTYNMINDQTITFHKINYQYLFNLSSAVKFGYRNILYNPMGEYEKPNDNSIVMLFRSGSFTLASLGDVEDPKIATSLMSSEIFTNEVDVMILAHHGADNGFTTDEFIKKVNPSVAVCSSNYDNQFDHPKPEIRKILDDNSVRIYTTKTGDIVIASLDETETQYRVINLIANSEEISSHKDFYTKRAIQRSPMLKNLQRYLR